MQIDFHHAVTYVVARLAGFVHSDASTVAYASQYVDDSTNKGTIQFNNGDTYDRIASAYKVYDVLHNCSRVEDYEVWVPFHFLPGNNGAPAEATQAIPLYQRLVCTPDSPLSKDMWNQCRAKRGDQNGLHRLGITAHTYLDTFSHQMFAGFRHQINYVTDLQHLEPLDNGIMERIESAAVDEIGLGHGGAITDPDLPYLRWSYKNGFKQPRTVSNQDAFLLASRSLFYQFIYYLGRDPDTALEPHDMEMIKHLISFNITSDPTSRHQSWLAAIRNNSFSFGGLSDPEFEMLNYIPIGVGSWKFLALGTTEHYDMPGEVFSYDERFQTSDWKKFHDALKDHQDFVLNVILPRYKLPRSYEEAKGLGL